MLIVYRNGEPWTTRMPTDWQMTEIACAEIAYAGPAAAMLTMRGVVCRL